MEREAWHDAVYRVTESRHPCPTLYDPIDYSPPGSSVHGDSAGNNTGVSYLAILQGNLPNAGIEPRSSALPVDSLPSEPSGTP